MSVNVARPSRAPWLLLAVLAGCMTTARHHVSIIGDRRGPPPAQPCEHPPIHTDRGPDRPREALAVITAECDPDAEAACRREIERGVCEAGADAAIEVRSRIVRRVRRMVGTAVEYAAAPAP